MVRTTIRDVSPLLHPRSIAIVGASQRPDSWPARVFRNLNNFGFEGPIYPVNPNYDELYGTRCYHSISAIPEPPDHLVILVKAELVPAALEEAGPLGTRSATIFTGGFAEFGTPETRALQDRAQEIADRYGICVSGPNCLGNVSMPGRLVTYSEQVTEPFRPGHFAMVAQSSGIMGGTFRYAAQRGVGVSYGIAAGNELNTDVVDYLHFLLADEQTRFIGLMIEGIRRPELFMQVCERLAGAGKPIGLLKSGRSAKGQEATLAHTGVLAGTREVFESVVERYGLIPVESTDDLVDLAELATRTGFKHPTGLAAGSLSGGVRGLVADLGEDLGIAWAELAPATIERLGKVLGVGSGIGNPIDIGWGGLSSQETYLECVEALLDDPNVTALALQEELPRAEFAGERAENYLRMEALGRERNKPVMFYARGSYPITEYGLAFHERSGAAFLQDLRRSFLAIRNLMHYPPRRAEVIRERVIPTGDPALAARWQARLSDSRGPLPDDQAFQLLADFGLPVAPYRLVRTASEAEQAAAELGWPVALKLSRPGLTHKTELGGVALNLETRDELRAAADRLLSLPSGGAAGQSETSLLVQSMAQPGVELFLSCSRDAQFGPMLYLGLGGVWVEVLKDVQLRPAPIDAGDARGMVERLRGNALLRGARGRPAADEEALVAALVALGAAGAALGESLGTIEINPFIVGPQGRGGSAVDVVVLPGAAGPSER
jgi:acetyltransferase